MSGTRCTGACCEKFALTGLGRTPEEVDASLRGRLYDGQMIADMIVPLYAMTPGALAPNGAVIEVEPAGGGWVFTCRHFDAATRNCGVYERRPLMCRDYPYGKPCEHFDHCAWDRAREGLHPDPAVRFTDLEVDERGTAVRRVHLRLLDDDDKEGT